MDQLQGLPGILGVKVAPNPVKSKAKLIISTGSNLPLNLKLIDLSGRLHKTIRGVPGSLNVIDIVVDDLPAGVYTIVLSQGNLSTHARMVVSGSYQ